MPFKYKHNFKILIIINNGISQDRYLYRMYSRYVVHIMLRRREKYASLEIRTYYDSSITLSIRINPQAAMAHSLWYVLLIYIFICILHECNLWSRLSFSMVEKIVKYEKIM